MKPDTCPSCHAVDATTVDAVDRAQLVAGYAGSGLGIDVSQLLAAAPVRLSLQQCRTCGLKWFAGAPAGDGPFYVALQRHDWYYQGDKAEYGYARGHVGPTDRVLEVGCGRGAFRAQLGPDVVYRGLEFNQGAVQAARQAGLDVDMRGIDAEAQALPAGYDVVCHFQVLEHVDDPAGFMRHCVDALRPGGKLVVAVPAEDSFIGLAESSWLNMPPHHLSRWTAPALRRAFEQLGVEPLAAWHEPVSPLHRAWHRSVVVNAGWLSLARTAPRLVARSAQRMKRLALRLPGVEAALYARGLAAYPQAARGHSLCMAGVKR